MNKTFIIAEIGINHNGSVELTEQLIDVAIEAGCDAVKFQKRTVEDVYSPKELDIYRESPWGTTNRQQKEGLEFNSQDYNYINAYCKDKGIEWFASPWDKKSIDFLIGYKPNYIKIPSAMVSNIEYISYLCKSIKTSNKKVKVFMSTGMCDLNEVEIAVDILNFNNIKFELMHCVSTYPMEDKDANLNAIYTLQNFFGCDVGYSGHERGLQISIAAVAMGATSIERHITLDRTMYGSDQCASLEPDGLKRMVRDIRIIDNALGPGEKFISKEEMKIKKKLANPYWTQK